MRRHVEVTLDGGERVCIKLSTHPEWTEGASYETHVVRLLHAHGLPAPRVLALDTSRTLVPCPYLIQEWVGGVRLGTLLAQVSRREALNIYTTLGQFYARLHAIHGPRSGLWRNGPDDVLPVAPNDYMYRAEIVEGGGARALREGRISARTYRRAVALWGAHLDELKAHTPTLVHGSPFWWAIYLERSGGGWRVAKLAALGDMLWWDPAYDLAFLRYPPFGEPHPRHWKAFLAGYGTPPEERRLWFYLVLQRLCAAMGNYMAPEGSDGGAANRAWAARCLDDLDSLLDRLEDAG